MLRLIHPLIVELLIEIIYALPSFYGPIKEYQIGTSLVLILSNFQLNIVYAQRFNIKALL